MLSRRFPTFYFLATLLLYNIIICSRFPRAIKRALFSLLPIIILFFCGFSFCRPVMDGVYGRVSRSKPQIQSPFPLVEDSDIFSLAKSQTPQAERLDLRESCGLDTSP